MSKRLSYIFKSCLVLFIFLLSAGILLGQPGDPGGDPDVPITGLEILVGGGLIIGIKSLLSKRNKEK